jgi:hypothetical protein
VLLGVVSFLAGHDAIVIGRNQSWEINPDQFSVEWSNLKSLAGMAMNLLNRTPPQYHGTWVVQPVWAATHRSN